MDKLKYVAHYSENNDYEEFETFAEAKHWLSDRHTEDGCDYGFSEDTCNGRDFIAEITHRSEFIVEQDREKDGYKWSEEGLGYFIDGNPDKEEWIGGEHDKIGSIKMRNTRKEVSLEDLEKIIKKSDILSGIGVEVVVHPDILAKAIKAHIESE